MSMWSDFFSIQRKQVLMWSLCLSIALLVVGILLPSDNMWNIWSSLAINLSAAAVGTGITITYVDFMMKAETQLSQADALDMAVQDIEKVFNQALLNTITLFGFSFSMIDLKSVGGTEKDKIEAYLRASQEAKNTYMVQLGEKGDTKKINDKMIKLTQDKFKETAQKMDAIYSRYGYAMSNKAKTSVLKYMQQIENLSFLFDIHSSVRMDNAIKAQLYTLYSIGDETKQHLGKK